MNHPTQTILLALLVSLEAKSASPLDTWTKVYSGSGNERLFSVAYGGGRFVAAGEIVLSSSDARTWTESKTPINKALGLAVVGVAYGNGRFAAINWHPYWGRSDVFSSSDGVNWTNSWSASGLPYFREIIFARGQFVAAGVDATRENDNLGAVLISSDAVAWAQHRPATQGHMSAIAYGNGTFVAFGYEYQYENATGTARYTKALMTSTDGVEWVQRSTGALGGGASYTRCRVAFGGGQFVAVGHDDASTNRLHRNTILTSGDGVNWVERRAETAEYRLQDITYGTGMFVVVSGWRPILSSRDGIDWTQHNTGTDDWLNGITYGDGRFVAVGESGTILESGRFVELALNRKAGANELTLSLIGQRGEAVVLQASTDLISWKDVENATIGPTSSVELSLADPIGSRLFYRALQAVPGDALR